MNIKKSCCRYGQKEVSNGWTEACLTFPALDEIKEGYEVYAVVDAVGGTSKTAHKMELRRMEQASVKFISWVQLACELQRDWNREETKVNLKRYYSDNFIAEKELHSKKNA